MAWDIKYLRQSRTLSEAKVQHSSRSQYKFSGFSLIEIIVAMGILTVSLVGLLALFPVALSTAADSKAETRVTQIAQSVFADLSSSTLTNASLIVGPNLVVDIDRGLDLSQSQTLYLSYHGDGTCVGKLTAGDYTDGVAGKGEFFLKLTSAPILPTTSLALSTLTLSVETPARAPALKRKKYTFVTIKGEL